MRSCVRFTPAILCSSGLLTSHDSIFSLFFSLCNHHTLRVTPNRSVTYTLFDAKWIPSAARFVALGNHARGTGAIEVFGLEKGQIVRAVAAGFLLPARLLFAVSAPANFTLHVRHRPLT